MASATTNNARRTGPRLLDLPCEVRMHIYRFLFEDARIRIHFNVFVDSLTAMLSPGRNRLHDIELEGFPRSITQTCRLLRVESRPVLRDATTLNLCSSFDCCLTDPDPREFLLSLSTGALQHTRKLSVDWYLLEDVPLHSFHELEVLKVTQVKCASEEGNFTMEEALAFTDQEAVRAIKESNEDMYPCWLTPPLGHTRRNYRMLYEGLIGESYGDFEGSGPSLVSLFAGR